MCTVTPLSGPETVQMNRGPLWETNATASPAFQHQLREAGVPRRNEIQTRQRVMRKKSVALNSISTVRFWNNLKSKTRLVIKIYITTFLVESGTYKVTLTTTGNVGRVLPQ